MLALEIDDNPNCPRADLRVFHPVEAARPVRQIRLERSPGQTAWYDVTGWTRAGAPCPAVAQKVDDSGDGVALLVHGGDAGLRLRPAEAPQAWRLETPSQWGEAFLILTPDTECRPAAEER